MLIERLSRKRARLSARMGARNKVVIVITWLVVVIGGTAVSAPSVPW
jgi:hypothetical protein